MSFMRSRNPATVPGAPGSRAALATMAGTVRPSDERKVCPNCMRWHPLPKCDHNAEAACTRCKGPVGYLWTGDDGQALDSGGLCFRCFDRVGMDFAALVGLAR
jgi:hypothetical protein